jgi:DNA-binding MarR family transcriptional regulator
MNRKQHKSKNDIAARIAADCVASKVRRLSRKVSRIYDEELRSHRVKISQVAILVAVARLGPVQPVTLGRRLSIEKSTLTRNVQRMVAQGWISARPGPEGNTQLLTLTPKGARLLRQAAPRWRRAQKRAQTLLGGSAVDAVSRMVQHIASGSGGGDVTIPGDG